MVPQTFTKDLQGNHMGWFNIFFVFWNSIGMDV